MSSPRSPETQWKSLFVTGIPAHFPTCSVLHFLSHSALTHGLSFALILILGTQLLRAQTTSFTYQGRLNDTGAAANGIYDLRFTIFDSAGGTNLVGGPLTNSVTAVTNGLFTVTLDFGSAIFNGADRWLEIGVRTNSGGPYQTLSPRQLLTSAPYAIRAGSYTGAIADTQLSGNIPRLNGNQAFTGISTFNGPFNTFTGLFAGNGLSLSNLSASALSSGVIPDGRLSGTYTTAVSLASALNSFSGNGGGLVGLNANALSSGTVPDARLSGTYSSALTLTNPANSFAGDGSGLGNIGGISNGAVSITMLAPTLAQRIGIGPYGYGTDSNVTISGTTTLTRDMFYSNLTINAGAILNTAGFRVFVRDTCTIAVGGVIQNNGGAASGSAAGAGAPANTLGGAGSGASGLVNSSVAGTNIVDALGGNGGQGGSGGVGGMATPVASTNGGPDIIKTFPNAVQGRQLAGGVIRGGAGGGSGLGSAGFAGGGGGGGGGVLMIAAHIITGSSATIQAKGGNGGTGTPGGGGGGGGGCVIIVTDLQPTGVTFSAPGGTGGGNGSAGAPGSVVVLY
jgi:hypothetical protein